MTARFWKRCDLHGICQSILCSVVVQKLGLMRQKKGAGRSTFLRMHLLATARLITRLPNDGTLLETLRPSRHCQPMSRSVVAPKLGLLRLKNGAARITMLCTAPLAKAPLTTQLLTGSTLLDTLRAPRCLSVSVVLSAEARADAPQKR